MKRALAVWAGIVALGCVSTQATLLDTTVRPQALCPDGVKVYLTEADVNAEFVKVALLQSKGSDEYTSESGMINSQRKKAAELGANGIILGQQKDASAGAKAVSALFGTSANRKGDAVAIFVPSDTARSRQACEAQRQAK
jgi:hypothetical protein